ncbi:MAG: TonB family protein, partial [Deltaproteobacteria bacterium]|nr:TonB family protein [Deltaproteobacteria bacterium]
VPAPAATAAGTPAPGEAAEGAPAGADQTTPQPQLVLPQLTGFVHAPYPPEALQAGLQAAVKLSIQLDETGTVREVTVIEPVGHGFDEAAVAAAREFRFIPAMLGDRPVGVTIRFTYRFTIDQQVVRKPAATEPPPTEAGSEPQEPPPTLTGRVLRRGDREPLAGVGVRVSATGLAAQTDAEGRFQLALPPGKWELEVFHPDCQPYKTSEQLEPGELLDVVYYVEARPRSRYRSLVQAARPKKTVTRTTLEDVELVQVPGTFGEPFRVVQTLPGVARTPFGLGFLLVRGAAPLDTGFFIDGHEVPLLYHFLSGPAVFQADLVQSIDFYPGNFPVEYGRKQAGIVTTRTKDEQPGERLHGQASIDLLDVEAMARLPLGADSQVVAAVRRSHFDALIPLITDETVRPRYWDYQAIGSTRLGAWRGKLTIFGSYDALDFADDPETEDDPGISRQATMGIQFHRLQGTLSRPLGDEGGRLELSTALAFDRILSAFNENEVVVNAYQVTLRADGSLPLDGDVLTLRGGTELNGIFFNAAMDVPGLRHWTDFPAPDGHGREAEKPRTRYDFHTQGYGPALYAALEWKLGPLLLIPGLRADLLQYETYTELVLDPRLVARLRLLDSLWLKGGVGVFHQLPDGQALDDKFGNPEQIKAPYALQYSFGGEYKPLEQLDLD